MSGSSGAPRLEMRGVRKAFSGVEVLKGVDLVVQAGEVHALVGENGAGKSTLIKVLAGVHVDHQGDIRLDGRRVRFRNPRDAEAAGVAVIHQELSLVPHLSVAENIFLGREPTSVLGVVSQRRMRAAAAKVLRERLGVEIDPSRHVADLPISMQQMVEIAKALSRDARVLVMDEPTSALTESDAKKLFAAIRQLKRDGVSIIYISHKMDEIYELSDAITVLRDGEYVGAAPAAELPLDRLVSWMVGRTIDTFFPKRVSAPGDVLLSVRDLWLRDADGHRHVVRGVSFDVRAGEVVGLAGLMGSGASETLGAIYGRYGTPEKGRIEICGRHTPRPTPRASLDSGVALLTNDRKASGLVLPMSSLHNASLATLDRCAPGGLLSGARERMRSEPFIERMKVRAPSLAAPVSTLSGGNQQKVLIARWLLAEPRVLLLDEPTRGIDVSAKADIYELLNELTAAGLGIVLITSELPELLALSDRILVMHRGRIEAEFGRDEATQENVVSAAMGVS